MPSPSPEIAGLPIGWGAIFSLLNALGIGAIMTAFFRYRAQNKRVDLDGDEKLRSEMWKDIEALKLSKEDMSRRLTAAETRSAAQTVQIGQQRFVLMLVLDELERVSPGNSVARQARVMLREVQPDALPHSDEIATLVETAAKIDPPTSRSDPQEISP